MTALELQARLAASRAALGDYQREVIEGLAGGPVPDWTPWSQRLAVELDSVCTALRGALSMLDDADVVLADQDASGLIVTGGLSIAPGDADTVTGALADAASFRRRRADEICEDCNEAPDDLCDEHFTDIDIADAYETLAARLGEGR